MGLRRRTGEVHSRLLLLYPAGVLGWLLISRLAVGEKSWTWSGREWGQADIHWYLCFASAHLTTLTFGVSWLPLHFWHPNLIIFFWGGCKYHLESYRGGVLRNLDPVFQSNKYHSTWISFFSNHLNVPRTSGRRHSCPQSFALWLLCSARLFIVRKLGNMLLVTNNNNYVTHLVFLDPLTSREFKLNFEPSNSNCLKNHPKLF